MTDEKPTCEYCGPRVKASYSTKSRYCCRKHLSTLIEETTAKGNATVVERLGRLG